MPSLVRSGCPPLRNATSEHACEKAVNIAAHRPPVALVFDHGPRYQVNHWEWQRLKDLRKFQGASGFKGCLRRGMQIHRSFQAF
jgi:hypothetical protein